MSTTYNTSMFDQIKSALSKNATQSNSKFRDILKFEPGNVYTVRFVPNVDNPEKTFFRYYTHGWNSFSTGQYISAVSPTTWGDKDPIAETRAALYRHGTDEEKEKVAKILRRENWLANVYVVNDPTTPDNNGQVKLLRFGKQLNKIIMDAIEGEDSDEFGARIFDLSKDGCNFKIKCERQGDFPTYVSSRFASPSKISGMTNDKMTEIHEDVTDLETVFTVKSYDELKTVLDEHFYGKTQVDDEWSDGETVTESATSTVSTDVDDVDPLDDDKVKELLDGLGD